MKKPRHTIVHHGQIWARLVVPADVRVALKTKMFLEKIGPWPGSFHEVAAVATAKVAGWQRQIDAARNKPIVHTYFLASENQSGRLPDGPLPNHLPPRFMTTTTTPAKSKTVSPDHRPFLHYLEEWRVNTNLKKKSLSMAVSDIKQFAEMVPETLESLRGGHVQGWIETLLKTNLDGTVQRKRNALANYWNWLLAREYVEPDRKPFEGRKIKDKRTKVERMLGKRLRFEPADVPKLIAATAKDRPLQDVVRLLAYTGARREGIASLKTDSVIEAEGIPSLRIAEKSEAGVRLVPIHSEIADLVARLVREAENGFLIPSSTDKHGRRGDALGKRFTRLKQRLGYDRLRTLHSIRHTVISLLKRAGCPLEVRNEIVGHDDSDGDPGQGAEYGGYTVDGNYLVYIDQEQKLRWVEKAIKYPV